MSVQRVSNTYTMGIGAAALNHDPEKGVAITFVSVLLSDVGGVAGGYSHISSLWFEYVQ